MLFFLLNLVVLATMKLKKKEKRKKKRASVYLKLVNVR